MMLQKNNAGGRVIKKFLYSFISQIEINGSNKLGISIKINPLEDKLSLNFLKSFGSSTCSKT